MTEYKRKLLRACGLDVVTNAYFNTLLLEQLNLPIEQRVYNSEDVVKNIKGLQVFENYQHVLKSLEFQYKNELLKDFWAKTIETSPKTYEAQAIIPNCDITGRRLLYANCKGKNYYLTLAGEHEHCQQIFHRISECCFPEFPQIALGIHYGSLNFLYQSCKGRITEMAIERMFLEIGCQVKKIGIEYAGDGWLQRILEKKDLQIAKEIRKLPDFLVQYPNGETRFVEVKYRNNETLKTCEINYMSGIDIIVASKNGIFFTTSDEVKNKAEQEKFKVQTPFNVENYIDDPAKVENALKVLEHIKAFIKEVLNNFDPYYLAAKIEERPD